MRRDVVVCADGRFRIGASGVLDVVEFESRKSAQEMMALDLVNLGRLALGLAVGAELGDAGALHRALELCRQAMSSDLCTVLEALVSRPASRKELSAMLGEASLAEMAIWQNACDVVGDAMDRGVRERKGSAAAAEARVREREAGDGDGRTVERERREVCTKLFKDYVFHQVDDAGRPSWTWPHGAGPQQARLRGGGAPAAQHKGQQARARRLLQRHQAKLEDVFCRAVPQRRKDRSPGIRLRRTLRGPGLRAWRVAPWGCQHGTW